MASQQTTPPQRRRSATTDPDTTGHTNRVRVHPLAWHRALELANAPGRRAVPVDATTARVVNEP